MTLTDLADRVGIALASTVAILKTGKAKAIRFSTLAAICAALDCQPGDVLEFEGGKKQHPRLVRAKPADIQAKKSSARHVLTAQATRYQRRKIDLRRRRSVMVRLPMMKVGVWKMRMARARLKLVINWA